VTNGDLHVNEYLKPRDAKTLPKRRGREASSFYPSLLEAFMSLGQEAMEVDVAKIGRRPQTVRSALAKAIRTGGLQEKVRVSLIGEEVILLRR